MSSDPHDTYKSTQVETASQEKILLMLYEGLLNFSRTAKKALQDGENEKAHNNLLQAQDIVTEFISSLDVEIGGEVAEELMSLYDYILHNLVQANVEKDPSRLEDIIPVIEELNDTWDEVINEKGMTVEKARKKHTKESGKDTPEEPGKDHSSQQSSKVSQEQLQNVNTSTSPSSNSGSDKSFDGSATYGDI